METCDVVIHEYKHETAKPTLPENTRIELHEFSTWVLAVGNGTLPMIAKEGEAQPSWIIIPDDLLVVTDGDKIVAIVNEVYPDFLASYKNPTYLSSRAIVCPANAVVDEINNYTIDLLPGESRIYLSCDTISKCSEQIPDFDLLYPPEFLNSINATNFPTQTCFKGRCCCYASAKFEPIDRPL